MNDSNTDSPTVQFPLTRGYIATVDKVDADLSLLRWNATPNKKDWTTYARRNVGRTRADGVKEYDTYLLHRVILERMLGRALAKGEVVDHIDGNGLNNSRSNLRLATNAENCRNRRKLNRNNKSGFHGVYWHKSNKKWIAEIRINGQSKHLGTFETAIAAAIAYNVAAAEHYRQFASLNIIPNEVTE